MPHLQKFLGLSTLLLWPMNVLGENINPGCIDETFTHVNATGHLVVPGFQGPIGHSENIGNQTHTPKSNWTINTAITEVPNGPNKSIVAQTFWLDSDPPITASPADLFGGCAILLQGFSHPRASTGTNASTSCDGVFDADCQDAIMGILQSQQNENNWATPDICQTILAKPPNECKSYAWTSVAATRPFGNPSFINPDSSSCPTPPSVFNATATHGTIISTSSDITTNSSNYTVYDTWVERATPLVLMGYNTGYQGVWFESRLVCLTTDNVVKGSRAPADGVVVSGAEAMHGRTKELGMVVALSVFGGAIVALC